VAITEPEQLHEGRLLTHHACILGKVIICDFIIIVSGVRTFALKTET